MKRFLLLAGMSALMAAPSIIRAEQFVVLDVNFSYTKADADANDPFGSHWFVKGPLINAKRPLNWESPVDYRNGTVHIRTEVLEKPDGGQPTQWTICYIPNIATQLRSGYGCTSTGVYNEKGVYEKDVSMTAFSNNSHLIWSEGIKQIDLIIKDEKAVKGHTRPDPERFFPTKIRLTMVQVSAGSTYDPSKVPHLDSVPKKESPKQ